MISPLWFEPSTMLASYRCLNLALSSVTPRWLRGCDFLRNVKATIFCVLSPANGSKPCRLWKPGGNHEALEIHPPNPTSGTGRRWPKRCFTADHLGDDRVPRSCWATH